MQESGSVFDELAKELSKDEREQILGQVNKDFLKDNNTSVSAASLFSQEKGVGQTENGPPLNQKAIKNDLKELNYFIRIALMLKAVFTRKTLVEVYIDYKLKILKNYIQSKGAFINFDNSTISARLVSEVYKIYTLILPLRNPHVSIWHNSEVLNHVITSLLSLHKSIPVLKTKPTDFIEFQDLLHLFIQKSDENSVKQAVLKSQRDYFNTIPSFVFRDTSEQLLPFYGLCSLLTYPSREMLILMGLSDGQQAENTMATYKPVLLDPVLPALEEFYSILLSISVINFDRKMTEFFLKESLSQKFFEQNGGENLNKIVIQNVARMDELITAVRGFLARVPMPEIFAFFHGDPFYKTNNHVIKLTIKNFYIKSSAVLIGGMLSETLQSLRLAYVNNSIDTLFKDTTLSPLKYYKQIEDKVWSSVGIHSFMYAKAMMLCANFLEKDYGDRIAKIKNVLMIQILGRNPGLQTKFQEFCLNIEMLKSEITSFDEALSPSSEQGKSFGHLQSNLSENINQARLVQAFVDHKDHEASRILSNVSDVLSSFVRFIREKIIETTVEAIQTQLASVYVEIDRGKPMRAILDEFVTHMYTFSFTLQELLKHEKIARHGENSK